MKSQSKAPDTYRMGATLPRRILGVGLVAAVGLGGCSHLNSRPPPPRPLQNAAECSDSRWPVVGDYYLAVNTGSVALLSLLGAKLIYDQQTDAVVASWREPKRGSFEIFPLLVVAMVSTVATGLLVRSANYGLKSARDCDAALTELYLRPSSARWPSGALVYPPPGYPPPGYPPPGYPPPGYPPPMEPQPPPPAP